MAEYNLIQAPEIIRKLAKKFGLRQAHITPALNEGVQAVVVLDDLTETDSQEGMSGSQPRKFACSAWSTSGVGTDNAHIWQPVVGGIVNQLATLRLSYLRVSSDQANPTRLRWGFRDTAIGGAVLTEGFPNRLQTPSPQPIVMQAAVSAPSTGVGVISQVLGEGYIGGSAGILELFGDDNDYVILPGQGFVVQTFGANNPGLASYAVWDFNEV